MRPKFLRMIRSIVYTLTPFESEQLSYGGVGMGREFGDRNRAERLKNADVFPGERMTNK